MTAGRFSVLRLLLLCATLSLASLSQPYVACLAQDATSPPPVTGEGDADNNGSGGAGDMSAAAQAARAKYTVYHRGDKVMAEGDKYEVEHQIDVPHYRFSHDPKTNTSRVDDFNIGASAYGLGIDVCRGQVSVDYDKAVWGLPSKPAADGTFPGWTGLLSGQGNPSPCIEVEWVMGGDEPERHSKRDRRCLTPAFHYLKEGPAVYGQRRSPLSADVLKHIQESNWDMSDSTLTFPVTANWEVDPATGARKKPRLFFPFEATTKAHFQYVISFYQDTVDVLPMQDENAIRPIPGEDEDLKMTPLTTDFVFGGSMKHHYCRQVDHPEGVEFTFHEEALYDANGTPLCTFTNDVSDRCRFHVWLMEHNEQQEQLVNSDSTCGVKHYFDLVVENIDSRMWVQETAAWLDALDKTKETGDYIVAVTATLGHSEGRNADHRLLESDQADCIVRYRSKQDRADDAADAAAEAAKKKEDNQGNNSSLIAGVVAALCIVGFILLVIMVQLRRSSQQLARYKRQTAKTDRAAVLSQSPAARARGQSGGGNADASRESAVVLMGDGMPDSAVEMGERSSEFDVGYVESEKSDAV